MKSKNNAAKTAENKLVVTRLISAPCEMVYQAWTDPAQLSQWFSPAEIRCKKVDADVRVGGSLRIHMISEKGDHIAHGKYRKVIPNRHLQFTFEWKNYAMPDSVISVDFEDLGNKTRLTLTHIGLPDKEDVAEHKRGWTSLVRKFARLMKEKKIKA